MLPKSLHATTRYQQQMSISLDAMACKTAERVLRHRTLLFTLCYTTLAGSSALSARPSLSADQSPCTGCYKLILLTLYGGPAAAVRQCHLNHIHFYYYYHYHHQLVSWSLTSLFSTNMAISETNYHHHAICG